MRFYPTWTPCTCGSNEPRRELIDVAGNFCTFICDACEDDKIKRYDPSIFDSHSSYAVTGEEEDIGRYPGKDY